MANHHDNHGSSTEKKPVSFTVPLILAIVTWVIMLSLVRLGDPCHCDETCAAECTDAHAKAHGQEAGHGAEGHDKGHEEAPKGEGH